jgi:L-ascorbate metabolism protein UlaG (beta-lactamase superfamily)
MKSGTCLTGIILITSFLWSCSHDGVSFNEEEWLKAVEGQRSEKLYAPHWEDGKFFNPWMPMERGGFFRFLKWRFFSVSSSYTDQERAYKPDFIPGLKERIRSLPTGDFIAWIGHGTFLIRIDGAYWLIDPMFSERAWIPKRVTPPALRGEELSEISETLSVIISHNHYDHLDKKSIRSLPVKTRFFVPLGLKGYVRDLHGGEVKEMDWWESVETGVGTKLYCLPSQHWSRRLGQSGNTTLWASFLLTTPKTTIYFGGDSGYFVGYREFGRRFPNIDYALMPTTAYHPRWFMHYAHMNIREVLNAFQALQARFFIPTQWGAFQFGDQPPGYPVLDLKRGIEEMSLDASRFIIMDIGQILPLR